MKTKKIDLGQIIFINENNKKVIENDKLYNFKMKVKRKSHKIRQKLNSLFDLLFNVKYEKCKYYDNYFKEEPKKKGAKKSE